MIEQAQLAVAVESLRQILNLAQENLKNTSVLCTNPPMNEVAFHARYMASEALKMIEKLGELRKP